VKVVRLSFRRHSTTSSLLNTGRNSALRKFDNEPIEEAVLNDRIEKLECLVGGLKIENDFLKRLTKHPQPACKKWEINSQ
jgi:hypothetical protein